MQLLQEEQKKRGKETKEGREETQAHRKLMMQAPVTLTQGAQHFGEHPYSYKVNENLVSVLDSHCSIPGKY